jgi:competence protein ComEC
VISFKGRHHQQDEGPPSCPRLFQGGMTRAILSILLLLVATSSQANLRIYHIDVEQADATLIVSPTGESMLVDSGKNGHGGRLKAAMGVLGITQIDHLIITHYHEDHYGGADDLLKSPGAVPVVNVHDRGDKTFLPSAKRNQTTFKDYETALGHRAHHIMRGETINLGPQVLVTCISSGGVVIGETNPQFGHDVNDMSVSLLVQFGDFRYFVGGDIESFTELKIAGLDAVGGELLIL